MCSCPFVSFVPWDAALALKAVVLERQRARSASQVFILPCTWVLRNIQLVLCILGLCKGNRACPRTARGASPLAVLSSASIPGHELLCPTSFKPQMVWRGLSEPETRSSSPCLHGARVGLSASLPAALWCMWSTFAGPHVCFKHSVSPTMRVCASTGVPGVLSW